MRAVGWVGFPADTEQCGKTDKRGLSVPIPYLHYCGGAADTDLHLPWRKVVDS